MNKWYVGLCLMMVGGLAQATVTGVNSGYWSDTGTWNIGVLPLLSDKINIAAGKTVTLTSTAAISQVALGDNGNQGSLVIDGGQLITTTTAWGAVGYNSPCSLLITGDGSFTTAGRLDIGLFDKYDGAIHFTINSGTLDVGGALRIGPSFDGIDDVSTSVPVTMTAKAHINGGTATAVDLSIGALNAVMDVAGGTLIIDGDLTGDVATWTGDGRMTAFGGSGAVRATYDSGAGKTTIIGVPDLPAGIPSFDVNLDGFDDLVHVRCEEDVFSVDLLLSDGSATFSLVDLSGSVANHASEDKWLTGDFNGDGALDLARLWGGADGNVYCEVETTLQDGTLDLVSWAAALGDFAASQRWLKGDFNGDGMDDLAAMPYNGNDLVLNVYLSTGSGFARSTWWNTSTGRAEKDWFFVGDVTGDGAADLIRMYESGGNVACRVYAVNGAGTAFLQSDWNPSGVAYVPDHRWIPGYFNGDNRIDFAVLRSDAGEAKVDVLLSTGSGFSVQPNWINGGAAYTYGEEIWYPGDFSGDGTNDLVKIYNDGGLVSADVYVSTASGFTHSTWLSQQGAWQDSNHFYLTDFDGDDLQDLICMNRSEYQSIVDLYHSTGSGFNLTEGTHSQLNRFGSVRGAPSVRRHKYFDPNFVIGPLAADGGNYNDVCRSGQDIYLKQGAEYIHTDATTSAFIAYTHQQVFETFEADTLDQFATIVRESLTAHNLVRLWNFSSTRVQNLIGDGRRYHTTTADVTAGFENGSQHFAGGRNASYQRFSRVYAFNSVGQSAFKIQEADAALRNTHRGNRIENCFVFGAGVDPRGSGRNPNVEDGWADAIGLTSRETVIRNNLVIDGTDVGIVLFTAPDSIVEENVVATISRSGLGGINLVDCSKPDEWVIGGADAWGRLKYDFSSLIQSNYLDARGSRIDIGIPVGFRTWAPKPPVSTNNPYGIEIYNNTLDGGAFGYGIAIANAFNITATGNVSTATHSGQGGYFAVPHLIPDPASAFAYQPFHTVDCTYGPEFVEASDDSGLDFLLFNTKNGRTQTADGYLYVAYTTAEAEATVELAFLEMLHRYPSPAERTAYANGLISTMDRADDLRVALMQLPEFDEANPDFSGDKTVNGMQIYRTGQWLDNLKQIDAVSYNHGGNYPVAKELYQNGLGYLTDDYLPAGSIVLSAAAGGLNLEYEGALMTSTNLSGSWQVIEPEPGSPVVIEPDEPRRFFKAAAE